MTEFSGVPAYNPYLAQRREEKDRLDPEAQTLEAFQLEGSNWLRIGGYSQAEKVRVAPFEVIEIDLSLLWPTPPGPPT